MSYRGRPLMATPPTMGGRGSAGAGFGGGQSWSQGNTPRGSGAGFHQERPEEDSAYWGQAPRSSQPVSGHAERGRRIVHSSSSGSISSFRPGRAKAYTPYTGRGGFDDELDPPRDAPIETHPAFNNDEPLFPSSKSQDNSPNNRLFDDTRSDKQPEYTLPGLGGAVDHNQPAKLWKYNRDPDQNFGNQTQLLAKGILKNTSFDAPLLLGDASPRGDQWENQPYKEPPKQLENLGFNKWEDKEHGSITRNIEATINRLWGKTPISNTKEPLVKPLPEQMIPERGPGVSRRDSFPDNQRFQQDMKQKEGTPGLISRDYGHGLAKEEARPDWGQDKRRIELYTQRVGDVGRSNPPSDFFRGPGQDRFSPQDGGNMRPQENRNALMGQWGNDNRGSSQGDYRGPSNQGQFGDVTPRGQTQMNRGQGQMDQRSQAPMDLRGQGQMDNRGQGQMDNRGQGQMDNRGQGQMDMRQSFPERVPGLMDHGVVKSPMDHNRGSGNQNIQQGTSWNSDKRGSGTFPGPSTMERGRVPPVMDRSRDQRPDQPVMDRGRGPAATDRSRDQRRLQGDYTRQKEKPKELEQSSPAYTSYLNAGDKGSTIPGLDTTTVTYKCTMCAVTFPSKQGYDLHCNSFLHTRNLSMKRDSEKSKRAVMKPEPTVLECEVCEKQISITNWKSHMVDDRHLKKVALFVKKVGKLVFIKRYPSLLTEGKLQDPHYCKVCSLHCFSKTLFYEHTRSTEHKSMVESSKSFLGAKIFNKRFSMPGSPYCCFVGDEPKSVFDYISMSREEAEGSDYEEGGEDDGQGLHVLLQGKPSTKKAETPNIKNVPPKPSPSGTKLSTKSSSPRDTRPGSRSQTDRWREPERPEGSERSGQQSGRQHSSDRSGRPSPRDRPSRSQQQQQQIPSRDKSQDLKPRQTQVASRSNNSAIVIDDSPPRKTADKLMTELRVLSVENLVKATESLPDDTVFSCQICSQSWKKKDGMVAVNVHFRHRSHKRVQVTLQEHLGKEKFEKQFPSSDKPVIKARGKVEKLAKVQGEDLFIGVHVMTESNRVLMKCAMCGIKQNIREFKSHLESKTHCEVASAIVKTLGKQECTKMFGHTIHSMPDEKAIIAKINQLKQRGNISQNLKLQEQQEREKLMREKDEAKKQQALKEQQLKDQRQQLAKKQEELARQQKQLKQQEELKQKQVKHNFGSHKSSSDDPLVIEYGSSKVTPQKKEASQDAAGPAKPSLGLLAKHGGGKIDPERLELMTKLLHTVGVRDEATLTTVLAKAVEKQVLQTREPKKPAAPQINVPVRGQAKQGPSKEGLPQARAEAGKDRDQSRRKLSPGSHRAGSDHGRSRSGSRQHDGGSIRGRGGRTSDRRPRGLEEKLREYKDNSQGGSKDSREGRSQGEQGQRDGSQGERGLKEGSRDTREGAGWRGRGGAQVMRGKKKKVPTATLR